MNKNFKIIRQLGIFGVLSIICLTLISSNAFKKTLLIIDDFIKNVIVRD
jgi:hypothetical protein